MYSQQFHKYPQDTLLPRFVPWWRHFDKAKMAARHFILINRQSYPNSNPPRVWSSRHYWSFYHITQWSAPSSFSSLYTWQMDFRERCNLDPSRKGHISTGLLHFLSTVPATLLLGMRFPVKIRSFISIQYSSSVANTLKTGSFYPQIYMCILTSCFWCNIFNIQLKHWFLSHCSWRSWTVFYSLSNKRPENQTRKHDFSLRLSKQTF